MIIISRLLFFVIKKHTSKLVDDDEMENDELKIYYVYVEMTKQEIGYSKYL